MYAKKDKFVTQIAYVQDKISPQLQQIYTGMPVMPVTNFKSNSHTNRRLRENQQFVFVKSIYANIQGKTGLIKNFFLPFYFCAWKMHYLFRNLSASLPNRWKIIPMNCVLIC